MSHKCEMLSESPTLRVLVVYIAVSRGQNLSTYAPRFIKTFLENPPGFPCDIVLACNGGQLPYPMQIAFEEFAKRFQWGTFSILNRPNDQGFDISAFQEVAETVGKNYDFMVCLGESCYFFKPGWLEQWASARIQLGSGMYGVFSTNVIRTHLHTTAFGCDPKFLRSYPPVTNHGERYEFEHGSGCLWHRLTAMGGRPWLVTWDGVWEPQEWRVPQNIIWRDDQSNCLLFCNHTDRHRDANPLDKFTWSRNADNPFKL